MNTLEDYFQGAIGNKEDRFRVVFERSTQGISLTTPDGKFQEVNSAFAGMLGYTTDELKKLNLTDITHPDDLERSWDSIRRLLNNEIESDLFEKKYWHKNGQLVNTEVSTTILRDTEGNPLYFITSITDITERIRVREELVRSEVLFRVSFDQSPVATAIVGLDKKFIRCNGAMIKFLGWTEEELIGRTISDVTYPDDVDLGMKELKEIVQGDLDFSSVQKRYVKKDGSIVWGEVTIRLLRDSQNKPMFFLPIILDINDRKISEEKIQLLAHMVTSVSECICIADMDDKILFVNPAFAKTYGYDEDELIGQSIHMVRSPYNDTGVVEQILPSTLAGGWEGKLLQLKKDGTEFPVKLSTSVIRDPSGQPMALVGIATDISTAVESEALLRESEAKYKNIVDFSPAGIYRSTLDGTVNFFNQSFANILGYKSIEEIKKLKLPDDVYYDPDDRDRLIQQISDNDIEAFAEIRFKKKDGSPVWVQNYVRVYRGLMGKIDHFEGFVTDIDVRKKHEESLLKLSTAVEQSPANIIITDRDGHIEYANQKFVEVTGYSLQEALGKTPRIIKSDHHSEEFYQNLWDTILSGKDWQGEIMNRKKNGENYWENVLISPIQDEAGNITNFVGVKEDITQKKILYEELVVAKQQAEESDQLKSAFLANMSHEIRTPMNGILGFIELMQDTDLAPEELKRYTQIIGASSERLMTTINNIIEISKIESGQAVSSSSDVNINEVVENHYLFFEPEAQKKGILLLQTGENVDAPYIIQTDKNKLDSILTNFLKNALKFTQKGTIEFGYRIQKEILHFYVRDEGIGIEPEKLDTIFERFTQIDSTLSKAHEGSGLGLSISKAYGELLGGTVGVESVMGKGSTFYFDLPIQVR